MILSKENNASTYVVAPAYAADSFVQILDLGRNTIEKDIDSLTIFVNLVSPTVKLAWWKEYTKEFIFTALNN